MNWFVNGIVILGILMAVYIIFLFIQWERDNKRNEQELGNVLKEVMPNYFKAIHKEIDNLNKKEKK
jgi:hypothetical protein